MDYAHHDALRLDIAKGVVEPLAILKGKAAENAKAVSSLAAATATQFTALDRKVEELSKRRDSIALNRMVEELSGQHGPPMPPATV